MNQFSNSKTQTFSLSPLLIREIRIFLRSNKAFLCLLVFLSAMLTVVLMNWAPFASHWKPDSDVAQGARDFFYTLTQGHLFLILILMPFLMAPAIVEEREKKTLDLLLSSPLSVLHLVFAKLVSPLLYIFLLLTSSLPVLALCFLGGGLGMTDVVYAYLLLLATALLYACLGIFCSTLRPRVYEVYLVAIGFTVVMSLVIPFHGSLWNYITEVNWKEGMSINHGFEFISPFYVLKWLIHSTIRISREMIIFIYVALSVALSGMLLYGTIVMVRRIASGITLFHEREEDEEEEMPEIRERLYDISFTRTSEEGNPGLVLERRVQWFARLPVLVRMFYCALMVSVLSLPLASYQGSWLFLSLPFVSAAFFTLPLAATSISSDSERETLPLLRTSLLSTKQIVYAKFITSLQYSFLIAIALYLPGMSIQLICSMMGYEVDLVTNQADTFAMISYPVILFFSLVMYTAWGLYCSAYCKHSNRSLLLSGLVILLTLVAPFLIPQIDIFSLTTQSYVITLFFTVLSPLAGITNLFPSGSIKYLDRSLFDIQTVSDIPYSFTVGQCFFFLLITYFLLRRTMNALEHRD